MQNRMEAKSCSLNNEAFFSGLKKKKYMRNILILLTVLLLPLVVNGQNKSPFSAREVSDVRVATPGLFAKDNHIYLHLDSLKDHEYAFPLPGGKVISAYGTRGGHSGTDIKTCAKDTIRAAFDGVVRMSKPYYAYGNLVVVRHANGLETIYSHNFKNLVQSGDTVKAGQPIGLTGRTGRATTEHVHFETRINGQHFNPNLIFNLKEGTLRKECIKCTKNGNGVVVKPQANNNRVAQNKK